MVNVKPLYAPRERGSSCATLTSPFCNCGTTCAATGALLTCRDLLAKVQQAYFTLLPKSPTGKILRRQWPNGHSLAGA